MSWSGFSWLKASLLWAAVARAQQLGWNHLTVDEDNELVAANFGDVPDIELLSPAFLNPESVPEGFWNGTSGPTDDATMGKPSLNTWINFGQTCSSAMLDFFLRSIANRNDWVTYQSGGLLSEEGRAIPTLFLSTSSQDSAPLASSNSTKLRVFIQGGIHGNEPAGDQGIMALLGKMDANQTWTASLLDAMDILVLPRYSPDGVYYFQRPSATNINPNRDHVKLSSQNARDIKEVTSAYHAHVHIDMHEYPSSWLHGGVYRQGADIQFGSGRNLNTHVSIRDVTENLFSAGVMERMIQQGFTSEPYVDGEGNSTIGSAIVFSESNSSPSSGRNAYGLTQSVAVLVEARGVFLGSQHFQRRVAASLLALEGLLEIARDNADHVRETVEEGIATFISSNDDIVINDIQPLEERNFTMVDTRDGVMAKVPVEFYGMPEANMTRRRPEAYLIPRNWAHLVEPLRVSGVEVETIRHEYHGSVEAYNVTSAALQGSWYEDVVRNIVTVEPIRKDLRLPAGSFRVSTRQKNAAIAFVLLEPEISESFVTFGKIPVRQSWEYPIFREMAGTTSKCR